MSRSSAEALAALRSAGSKDSAASFVLHPMTKAVLLCFTTIVWLKSAFHVSVPPRYGFVPDEQERRERGIIPKRSPREPASIDRDLSIVGVSEFCSNSGP